MRISLLFQGIEVIRKKAGLLARRKCNAGTSGRAATSEEQEGREHDEAKGGGLGTVLVVKFGPK
jgi:hypothetical protein